MTKNGGTWRVRTGVRLGAGTPILLGQPGDRLGAPQVAAEQPERQE